ncbi:hypothetical protein [Microbacterium panaciterrae]|uniref:DUF222 domain-containing protein n=1 Tax=Microbacterium panaciterrae TaxID=985759 RepID=A0ABP8P6C4_9MICO
MNDQLVDLFGRPVSPQPLPDDRPTRSVPQPPPDLADRPGHKITREALRMSGTSRAAGYSPPIHRATCSCGWSAESSAPAAVAHMTERHLITTPTSTTKENAS